MDRPKAINRDNSRRFYASDAEYPEHMRRMSDKAKDIRYKEKHSEFKKPWGPSEDFTEMEYWLDPPPGIDPFIYKPPYVDIPDPRDEPPPTGLAVLYCTLTGCYNDNAKTCLLVNCSYPIVGVALAGLYPGFNVGLEGGLICITAPKNASSAIEINILMSGKTPDGRSIRGSHDSIMITKCDPCADPPAFAADSGTNPSTMGQNDSVTVAVTGGVGPYDWSVSGTGFTLDNAQTEGLSNTLNSDGVACGTAVITVTDACSQTATIEVRNTTGVWTLKSSTCVMPGNSTEGDGKTIIIGGKKQYQPWTASGGGACGTTIHHPCESTDEACNSSVSECVNFNCDELTGVSGSSSPGIACCNSPCSPPVGGVVCSYFGGSPSTPLYYEWECI